MTDIEFYVNMSESDYFLGNWLIGMHASDNGANSNSLHFTLFTQQFKIQTQCVQYASYNSLGGCSKARRALASAPCNIALIHDKRKRKCKRLNSIILCNNC